MTLLTTFLLWEAFLRVSTLDLFSSQETLMSHRRRYSYGAGGRYRSDAWHMDGGANDEGWHYAYCSRCGKETEHGRGSGCVTCADRGISARGLGRVNR